MFVTSTTVGCTTRHHPCFNVWTMKESPLRHVEIISLSSDLRLIDNDVHFKHCLHLVKFVDGYTFKCLNWLVGVLGIEHFCIVFKSSNFNKCLGRNEKTYPGLVMNADTDAV